MVAVRVYVEGGGDSRAQRNPLRQAVATWLERALPKGRRPTVVACGGRREAYEDFARAVLDHPDAFCVLLVDSEEEVTTLSRWQHVKQRVGDGWDPPPGTDEDNLHFMAQTMEAWICADPEALASYFGHGFAPDRLPQRRDLERVPKPDLNHALAAATRESRRGVYRKGAHLDVLGFVAPDKVIARCALAGTLVAVLRARR